MKTQAFLVLAGLLPFALQAGDWPQWLGPARDGIAEAGPTLKSLPAQPKAVWRVNVGGGFSSPVVAGDHVAYLDEDGTSELAHVLDAKTGKEIWKVAFASRYSDEWGAGPRATPILDGDRLYATSCNGEFRCFNLADGKVRWSASFEKDFGVKFLGSKANAGTASRRGNNGSQVLDGNAVIVPVGGADDSSVVAFDKLTGKVLWKSGTDEAAYSSLVVADLAGVRHIVAFMADALVGHRRDNGKVLWRIPLKTNAKRHACTPIIIGDTITVASHTFGLMQFRISKDGGEYKAEQSWVNPSVKINLATPVLVGSHFYSHGPSKDFICAQAENGKLLWTQPGFGKDNSSTLVVGRNLLSLTDDGQLVLIEPNPAKYTELGRAQVSGKNWNFPAFANNRLFVRDYKELICYDLGNP